MYLKQGHSGTCNPFGTSQRRLITENIYVVEHLKCLLRTFRCDAP